MWSPATAGVGPHTPSAKDEWLLVEQATCPGSTSATAAGIVAFDPPVVVHGQHLQPLQACQAVRQCLQRVVRSVEGHQIAAATCIHHQSLSGCCLKHVLHDMPAPADFVVLQV